MSEFTLKIKLPGYKLCLFSLHPHTLELSFGHFQTLKDQGYQKFTQKIDDFDIAETPKMSVFEPKNPTVLLYKNLIYWKKNYKTDAKCQKRWSTLVILVPQNFS